MVDSKENYKFDLGDKWLRCSRKLVENVWKRIPHLMQQHNTPEERVNLPGCTTNHAEKSVIVMIFYKDLEYQNYQKKNTKKKAVKNKTD